MMKTALRSLCFLFLFSVWQGAYGGVQLTADGKPMADIVTGGHPHPAVTYAAQELQRWVKEISGAELPVREQAGAARLHVRLAVRPDGFAEDLQALAGNDGFAVRHRGDSVWLLGSCPKGVLNGVYRWLYRNTDIIWARPNPSFGTIYSSSPTLVFQHSDYRDVPVYRLRGWHFLPENHMVSEEWQFRNGSNWSASSRYSEAYLKFAPILEYGGGHNIVSLYITGKKYFDAHPDFFPLVDGKRVRPKKGETQLCFTNEAMTACFIEELEQQIQAHPNYTTYRIMIQDNWVLCQCPKCMKTIVLPDGKTVDSKARNFRSTQFFLWLNQIARYMQQRHPGKRILTFAYFFSEVPPACHVEPSISVSFCPIGKNSKYTLEEKPNSHILKSFLGWQAIGVELTWREYFGLTRAFPRPIDAVAVADWRYAHERGVNRTYSEMVGEAKSSFTDGIRCWDANGVYFWTMTQAAWNPYLDVKTLRREFFTRVFRDAADDVEQYYRIIEERWTAIVGFSDWRDNEISSWRNVVREKGVEQRLRDCLARAEKHQLPAKSRKMLEGIRRNFDETMETIKKIKLTAVRTEAKPVFNPEFDDPVWKQAECCTDFYWKRKPYGDRTELRLLYDQENIYVGVKCLHSDPDSMVYRKRTKGRWVFPEGEGFEVFLEERRNGKDGFYGQRVIDPVNNHYSVAKKMNWTSQAAITRTGWSGLVIIPWKDIEYAPEEVRTLRASFVRQVRLPGKTGKAAQGMVMIFDCARHNLNRFCDIQFK